MTSLRSRLIGCMLCLMLFGAVCRGETILVAWGDNYYGQTNIPAGLNNVIAIAGSSSHSLALSWDGTVTAWGWNAYGQGEVPLALNMTTATAIAAGSAHNLAITPFQTVFAWGNDFYGQTDVPTNLTSVVAVAGGAGHSLALRANGTVVAWGNNLDDQSTVPPGLTNVVAIAAGGWHSVALMGNGKIVAWGYDGYGQTDVPEYVSNIVAISAGALHTMALDVDGRVAIWGNNDYGQADVPEGLSNVVAIAAGTYHCMALKADGTVVAWGRNASRETNVPPELSNVNAIAPRSLALVGDNNAQCPLITEAPLSCLTAVGAPAFFRVNARGSSPLKYQWSFNGSNLPGETNTLLWLDHVQPTQAGLYRVTVQDGTSCSASSSSVRLNVAPLWVSAQPQDEVRNTGETAVFEGVVESTLPVSYQWRFGAQTLLDNSRISGAATPRLSISDVGHADAGEYILIASNALGVVSSHVAVLDIVSHLPVITCQPQSQIVLASLSANFRVCVESLYPDYSVQWLSNGIPIAGQTTTNLVLTNLVLESSAFYSCLVSNIDGVVFSDAAWLEVLPYPPLISSQPQTTNVWVETVTNAGFFTLSAAAAGPDLHYLWYKNGQWVPQTSIPTLKLYFDCGAIYDCYVVVTNQYGAATSSVARVTFTYSPPQVSRPPASTTAQWGTECSFYIDAITGKSPLTYQWRHNGILIPDANDRTLALSNITTNDGGYYDVIVTNCGGAVTSMAALLTVLTDPPRFTGTPQDWDAGLGWQANFSCAVTGAVPIAFQWYQNNELMPGQTNATLQFLFTNIVQLGEYSVVATNLFGAATNGAKLRMTNLMMVRPTSLSNGEFEFFVYSQAQDTCRIQASEDLISWDDIFTFTNREGVWRDTNAVAHPKRFYRLVAP